jgi:hypothetical protein
METHGGGKLLTSHWLTGKDSEKKWIAYKYTIYLFICL